MKLLTILYKRFTVKLFPFGSYSFYLNYIYVYISQIEKHGGSSSWEKEVDDYFTSRLANLEAWFSVPSLNEISTKDLRNGQLVRFRGMVQDQLGPEMYGSGALLKNKASGSQKNVTGKFKDELSLGVSYFVKIKNYTPLMFICLD